MEKFLKDKNLWQKGKLRIFIWMREIKKILIALKWIVVTNQRKTGLTFCFIAIWKEVKSQFHWSTKSCFSGMGPYWPHFQLKVRDSVTSSTKAFNNRLCASGLTNTAYLIRNEKESPRWRIHSLTGSAINSIVSLFSQIRKQKAVSLYCFFRPLPAICYIK